MKNKEIWNLWEKIAAKFLLDKWWKFLKNNYYEKNFWEIDLIFEDTENWNQVVFIEVKTRTSEKYWEWFEAIEEKKLKKMAKTWELFCLKNWLDFDETRFDVISILVEIVDMNWENNWEKFWDKCKIKHFKKVL